MTSNNSGQIPAWRSRAPSAGLNYAHAAAQSAVANNAGPYISAERRQSSIIGVLTPPPARPQPIVLNRQPVGRFPTNRPEKTYAELTDDLKRKLGEISKPSPNHRDQYIFPGVIIRVRHIEEKISGVNDPANVTFTDTRRNTLTVTPKLRYFIVVSTQDEQCFTAVPLFTYDRNGLKFFSESKKASYVSIHDTNDPATRNVEPSAANITGNGRLHVMHFMSGQYVDPMSVVFFAYPVSFLLKKTISIRGCLDESSRDLLLKLFYRFLSPEVAQLERWVADLQESYSKLESTRQGYTAVERDNMEKENKRLEAEVERLNRALNGRITTTAEAAQGSPSKRLRLD